jgi:hypothetical protein
MKELTWQEFEENVEEILKQHSFETSLRKVFKTNQKYEIDVVAFRYGLYLGIDCKLYGPQRYRLSQIKKEAEKHVERCNEFQKVVDKRVIPVLVTYIEEEIYLHSGCIIVPYTRLNDFLNNLEYYLDALGL